MTLSSYATGEGSEAKQRAAFCTYIDSSTFKLLCSLCAPNKPEELSLEQLQAKLDQQFGTKKLVLAERYRFYSYKQLEGQSLSEYIAELRHLAASCDWSAERLEDNIRDKFVMGLRNERLLQQLLTQDHKKPLDDLVELARVFEAAEHESLSRADSDKKSDSTVAANKPSEPTGGTRETRKATKRPAQNAGRNQQSSHCASCGGEHPRSTCRFRNAECHKCGKLGHIAKVCRSATAAVHNHPLESAVVIVNKSRGDQDIPPAFQVVYLPQLDKRLRLIVDTASPITFINLKTWQDLQKPKLENTTRVLGAFEGQPIKPVGYFQTTVVRQDDPSQSAMLKIYVSRRGINLIGRDGQVKL